MFVMREFMKPLRGRLRVPASRRGRTFGSVIAAGLIVTLIWQLLPQTEAAVNNDGVHFYGDATNLGQQKFQTYTAGAPGTMSAEINGNSTTASAIQYQVAKSAPTRREKIIGQYKADKRLDILRCVDPCSSAANMTAQWNVPLGPTNGVASFDIAYEQRSGRAIVVYVETSGQKLHYCIWDGSTWGPVSSCQPTVDNDIDIGLGTQDLAYVRLAAYGEQMAEKRSNEILLAATDLDVADGGPSRIFITRWTGSAWSTTDDQIISINNCSGTDFWGGGTKRTFDLAWETDSGTAMLVSAYWFNDGSCGLPGGTMNVAAWTSTGSGWATPGGGFVAAGGAPNWVALASDSRSNRIGLIYADTSTAKPFIWKSDGSTAGWTAGPTQETPDMTGENLGVAWEKANSGTPQALFVASDTLSNVSRYLTWTSGTGFGSWTSASGTSADFINAHQLVPSPNSDEIMDLKDDRDCAIRAQEWGGSTFETLILTNMEDSTITTTSGCSLNTAHDQRAWAFTYKPYSAWSMNWRWYDDESTAGNPTTPLAAEGVAPTITSSNIVRLRFNFKEIGGMDQTDTRKKLQFSTGAGCPDSLSCTWTDVGAQGGGVIWRYGDGGLTDDAVVPGTLLTSSTATGNVVENGTASAPNSDHTTNSTREYDYTVQNNGATSGTYFFRAYDFGASASGGALTDLNPLFRYQIKNTGGTEQTSCTVNAVAAVCEYATATAGAANSAPAAPTLALPADTATGVSTRPEFQLRTTDADNDYLQYKIEVCSDGTCSTIVRTINQVGDQSGWFNQDQQTATAYTGSSSINFSTMAVHRYLAPALNESTQYWWRAYGIDPGGSNGFGAVSGIFSFTTASSEVRIEGGVNIQGGTKINN